MTDDVDIMRSCVAEYDKAVKVKRLNQELDDHLLGSVIWLLKHSERYSIPLPHKQEMYEMVKHAEYLVDRMLEENKSVIPSPNSEYPFMTSRDGTEQESFIFI
jgi:hypothetical protein